MAFNHSNQIIISNPGPWGLVIQGSGGLLEADRVPLPQFVATFEVLCLGRWWWGKGAVRQWIHPYIFMEGRVNSFLLCLGDEELHAPSPKHTCTHRHTRPIAHLGFHGGYVWYSYRSRPSEYFIPNWLNWMNIGVKNVLLPMKRTHQGPKVFACMPGVEMTAFATLFIHLSL